ncbi:MAG TPA: SDR family NAD(P)-dependent oxidoreductase, partial [Dyadobacter sp.]|nr:SDR family NAD(P)-dependent oxidoreductase [Dyadobacter sp.]
MMTKTVLITGASSGFGKAAARLFQKNGWNVIASMRSPEKETELAGLDRVALVRLDVTDSASIQNAVEEGI